MDTYLAQWYPVVYQDKPYGIEATRIAQLAARYAASRNNSLLDVACGTGGHLEFLQRTHRCMGVDVSPEMIEVAKTRLPGVALEVADMRKLSLSHTFTTVICLFGAMGHMLSLEDLHAAAERLAAHTQMGGVVIVEPWLLLGQPLHQRVRVMSGNVLEGHVVRMARNLEVNSRLVRVTFNYLVDAVAESEVTHHTTHMTLARYSGDEYVGALERAGLRVSYIEPDHMFPMGLLIGMK